MGAAVTVAGNVTFSVPETLALSKYIFIITHYVFWPIL